MKFLSTSALGLCLFGMSFGTKAQDYSEQYRPQFHFSPVTGWIGDPDGTIKFNNLYHLFWWGHAVSEDLVYWTEYPWPMLGGDSTFDYYTGSVVVDTANTAGFGSIDDTVAVAIYTMHNKTTNIETQGISSSTDSNFKYFDYNNNNPVIPSSSNDFRDPSVFWDSQLNRWAMVITRPGEHQIEIYSSPDLKSWTKQSSFGPLGARTGGWEVPDLFQLPLDGDSNNKKWVMICGMGPNRGQYWVGDFNGTNFTPDATSSAYLKNGTGIPGEVFENFESTGYGSWTVEGTAFGTAPANGALSGQMDVSGYLGDYLANSFNGGDATTGKLSSPSFTITRKFINFLISGGNHSELTCINLVINGATVKTVTGDNSEQLKWYGWDVSDHIGETATLEIVDNFTGGWGHINVDQILFSDILTDQRYEHANWIDYGPDFYAVRTYRNYDANDNRTLWLGWMNNWEYANSIPTSWGGSTGESIPREIELISTDQGYKIRQHPIPELQKLRQNEVNFTNKTVEGTVGLNEFTPQKNTYEIEASFEVTPGTSQKIGFNLCTYGTQKLVVGFDEKTSNVFVDRRTCGYVNFDADFPKIVSAPVKLTSNEIKFHIFIDQLSAEVFINDGDVVLTSLIFPNPNFQKGIEAFAENVPATLKSFSAWELKSIWDTNPSTGIFDRKSNLNNQLKLYPNPAKDKITIELNSDKYKTSTIKIINLQGQEIRAVNESISGNYRSMDIHNLTHGYYIVQVSSGTEQFCQPFLKVN
ncbi:GH32 C-terminal domain-containing protein [Mangrovibacterium lignilyticum]|uniref:GH32 C-terminal domain-containing protein n=1 Tax=Mangrovibacterium lignilyticum TaxID=2668052 RepID=UPI0013D73C18|nr:GH32 C-terminal domain-containing protein [Mangrovibacterium lignilyticum]